MEYVGKVYRRNKRKISILFVANKGDGLLNNIPDDFLPVLVFDMARRRQTWSFFILWFWRRFETVIPKKRECFHKFVSVLRDFHEVMKARTNIVSSLIQFWLKMVSLKGMNHRRLCSCYTLLWLFFMLLWVARTKYWTTGKMLNIRRLWTGAGICLKSKTALYHSWQRTIPALH